MTNHFVKRGTPIYFEDKLIGLWTEDLAVQDNHFLIAVVKPMKASSLLEPASPIALAEYAVCFQVQYTKLKDINQLFISLRVDTLNGLRYIKQFLPEDSVLKKLPR